MAGAKRTLRRRPRTIESTEARAAPGTATVSVASFGAIASKSGRDARDPSSAFILGRRLIAAALIGAFATLAPAARAQGQADGEKAKAFVESYSGHPSPFPITELLLKKPTGKKIAVVDCGSPICGIFADIAEAPAKELGMIATRIKSGTTADGVRHSSRWPFRRRLRAGFGSFPLGPLSRQAERSSHTCRRVGDHRP